MREIGRAAQGYFATPPSVVSLVARSLRLEKHPSRPVVFCDAGCGEGKALAQLATETGGTAILMGVESDIGRAAIAEQLFQKANKHALAPMLPVLDAPIESSGLSGPASLLWFNPPYDRIRGWSRSESELFQRVALWPLATTGLMVGIFPDYVLGDKTSYLAAEIHREFEAIWLAKFPSVVYDEFRQCVLLARRRKKVLAETYNPALPEWAENADKWPVLGDRDMPVTTVPTVGYVPAWRRTEIDSATADALSKQSPLHMMLLRGAAQPAPPLERPPLALNRGHLALLLAGGACDGVVESSSGPFMVKGTCVTEVRHTHTKEVCGRDGELKELRDVYRTVHDLRVRCLRPDGTIEEYGTKEHAKEGAEHAD